MRSAAALLLVVTAGLPAGAVAAPLSAQEAAAAMQGCWNRVSWSAETEAQRQADPGYSRATQMCLEGGLEGALTVLDCGGANNLVECSPREGRYAFRDDKFWSNLGEQPDENFLHYCDVLLDAGKQVTLRNCQWAEPRDGADPIEDVTYEPEISQ